jgi:AcrR family transcriptional regulator
LREQILSSAAQLFIEQGYCGLSMRQIAESVGVTKAALYYHFKDKEDLFLAILEAYLERVEALVVEIQQEDLTCRDSINLLVGRILKQPVDQRAIIRLASQEMTHLSADSRKSFGDVYHTRFIHRIETMLEAGILAGELRNIDPKVATWSLLGMMYPYFYPVHPADVSLSDDAIEQLVSIFLDGLAASTV